MDTPLSEIHGMLEDLDKQSREEGDILCAASARVIRDLLAERDALRDGLEAACDVQNWIEDNVPDDLFERVPTEPWNRITEAVIIARANNPTSRNETAV